MREEALNDFVRLMTEALKQAKDFTLAQAPEVMKEVVKFGLAQAIAGVLFGILLLVLAWQAYKLIHRKCDSGYSDWTLGYPFVCFPATIAGLIFICVNSVNAMQAWLAPRVYLIEYFAELTKHK